MVPTTTPHYSTSTPAPFTPVDSPNPGPSSPNPNASSRGRPRGSITATGAKRGRKPRGASTMRMGSPRTPSQDTTNASPAFASPQLTHVHWAPPATNNPAERGGSSITPGEGASLLQGDITASPAPSSTPMPMHMMQANIQQPQSSSAATVPGPSTATMNFPMSSSTSSSLPVLDTTGLISIAGVVAPVGSSVPPHPPSRLAGVDEDGEGEDELLPAMADDDYSAQLSWQSQSKDNLKVLMDNFSPAQYDRFEAYRRHALPKQAVRRVIQQTVGQQVSQPVAQIIAGFAKVFVGEIIEKARAVQTRRGETGPLSPDHLREAYRSYQEETGRVGAARPVRAKKLFVR